MRCLISSPCRPTPWLVLVLLAFAGPAARAHDFSITDTLVVLKSDGVYQVDMTCDLDELLLGLPPGQDSAKLAEQIRAMPPEEFERAVQGLRELFQKRVRIRFDGQTVEPQVSFPEYGLPAVDPQAPPSVLGITARLSGRMPPDAGSFTFWASRSFAAVRLTIFRQGSDVVVRHVLSVADESPPFPLKEEAVAASRIEVVGQYLKLGFEHILPKGLDHILFVLGLFLLNTRWRPLLMQVTAFTLAHTLTLALSMYDVISLPSSVVEPLIALSIAYVAIENLVTSELKPWRPAVVFCFGLLHGMGFAGVLTELGLPRSEFVTALISFNVGVELGQLSVIAAAFLVVGWFQRRDWYRAALVMPTSALIAVVGLYWAVERTFA